jgi:Skp family chaperone for outer membrane proteins
MNRENLGWAVAGALAVSLFFVASTGFQDKQIKLGTVNIEKVFDESEIRIKLDSELREYGQNADNMMNFMASYPMLPNAELKKFKDLSLKTPQTDADKAEIERIRKAAVAADQKYRELQTKASSTEADKLQLGTFQRNVQENSPFLQRADQELASLLNDRQKKMRQETLEKVKAAIGDIANKQGYSIIFNDQAAPYSANDVTAEALKSVNSRK